VLNDKTRENEMLKNNKASAISGNDGKMQSMSNSNQQMVSKMAIMEAEHQKVLKNLDQR
jgi:hypothetical protein